MFLGCFVLRCEVEALPGGCVSPSIVFSPGLLLVVCGVDMCCLLGLTVCALNVAGFSLRRLRRPVG